MQSIFLAVTIAALLLVEPIKSCAAALPQSSAFDSPPYSSIFNGLPVTAGDLPSTSLSFSPGAAQVIFIYGQETNAASSTNSIWTPVEDARRHELLRADHLRSTISYAEAGGVIERFTNSTAVLIADDDMSVAELSIISPIFTEKSTYSVSVGRQSGGLNSAEISVDLSRPYEGTGTVTSSQSGSQIIVQRSKGGLQGVTGGGAIGQSQSSNVLHYRSGEATMQQPVHAAINAPLIEEGVTEMRRDRQAGGIDMLDEAYSVGILDDADFIRMLVDANVIDGFYDNANILMEAGLEVPPEEITAFREILDRGGALSEMLDRPFSSSLRTEERGSAETNLAEFTVGVMGNPVHHHGSRLMYTVSLTNRGKLPIHDALIFNALPDHTTFDDFPIAHAERNGVVQAYLNARSLIVWKLYRPLLPGETFRASYMVILDPWRVPIASL